MYRALHTLRPAPALIGAIVVAAAFAGCAEIEPTTNDVETTEQSLGAATGERYIVAYNNAAGRAAVEAAGGFVALELPAHDAVAAHLPEQAVDALSRNPNIDYVEIDARRYPSAEVTPWGVTAVQADLVDVPAGTGRVPVCIIDSGITLGHEDFAGLPVSGEAGAPWYTDGCGHGTHVAGTIAAISGNGLGVTSVADDAVSLHIVRVFGDDCGWTYSSGLVAALDECVASGAKVVSMSLGGSFKSRTEDRAFGNAYSAGVLSIAAAGNDGNTRKSYPASYDSVVSVAAVDSSLAVASFSQQNAAVELAGPGVSVLSTYPVRTDLTVGGTGYFANAMEFASGTATGTLVYGGRCTAPGSWAGALVLCERGDISFADKVTNAYLGGAAGAVIYNNEPGGFAGTLGAATTSYVPSVTISQADGQALVAGSLGQTATVNSAIAGDGYAELDGTSMATPHVSAVAALVWSHFPGATNADIRDALAATALDLGAAGRDNAYGFGFVQAANAIDYLGNGPDCSADGVCNGACDAGADPDCASTGPDCSADGVCNAECAAGDDPDCGGVCLPSGDRCFGDSECCSGACVPARRGRKTVCQ